MQNDTSRFVTNIIPLQNVNANVSGTNATNVLSNSVVALQQMVNTTSKTIKADYLQSFTTNSIGVLSGLNLCNVSITSNGQPYNTSQNLTSITVSTLTANSGTFSGICYAQQFVTLSDMLAKTDAREWRSPVLADLQKIHPYIFSYSSNTQDIGLMAQEVGGVWPNLVKEGVRGSYVNYDGVVALLVKAVQELGARVSTLEG